MRGDPLSTLEIVLAQPSLYPPSVQFADLNEELQHLFGLVDIEMSLLGESANRLGSMKRMGIPLKASRDLLPWKRGKTVVVDFAKLGAHCARIAELLPLIEAEEEKPVATPTPAADTDGTSPPTPMDASKADTKADPAPVS